MNKMIIVTRVLGLLFIAFLASCDSDDSISEFLNSQTDDSGIEVNLDKQLILSIINDYRTQGVNCGSSAKGPSNKLVWNDFLAQAAKEHCVDMFANDFSHTGSDGSSFSQRAKTAGFDGQPLGENIARGQGTEAAVMKAWIESTGHCNNIMNGKATQVGVARSEEGNYWTMVTGK